jgi:sulfonate transport system substrate-binding protein
MTVVGMTGVVALVGPGGAQASSSGGKIPPGTVLKVSDVSESLQVPLHLAGLDKNLPYTVQYSNLNQGTQNSEALIDGDIDIATQDDTSTIQGEASGVHASVIAVQKYNGPHLQLDAGPGITNIADLKGKKVAFTSGTATEGFLLRALAQAHLTLSDITQVNVPAAQVETVLAAGQAQAAVIYSFFQSAYFTAQPGAKILLSSTNISPGYSYDVILASNAALANSAKRAAILNYIGLIARAGQWGVAHPAAETTGYFTDVLQLPAAAATAFYKSEGPGTYSPIPKSLISGLQQEANLYYQVGVLQQKVNVSSLFPSRVTTEFNKVLATADKASP